MPGASCTRSLACSVVTRELVTAGTPTSSGIPCAMVLRLIRGRPGVPGFLATVAGGSSTTGLIPASGDQDHTISPSALPRSSSAAIASIASRPQRS